MAVQREWLEKDYYKVLGVAKTATDKEIARAYRKLAKQYHPDAHPGSEERFKEISAAYDVLGDQAKRKEYDEVRTLSENGYAGNPFGGAGAPRRAELAFRISAWTTLATCSAIFSGGAAGAARQGATAAGPSAASDARDRASSFLCGCCKRCDYDGQRDRPRRLVRPAGGPGPRPVRRPPSARCAVGSGVINENQGMFSFSHPVRRLRRHRYANRGAVPDLWRPGDRAARPAGKSAYPARRRGRPADTGPGKRGGAGRFGGPAGDLYVVVHIAPHPVFGQKGKDLTVKVPITFAEAALGTTVSVPTLNGKPVTVKVPAGTRSGRVFRVAGQGVQAAGKKGDLLVTFEVDVPAKLSCDERRAVEALAKASEKRVTSCVRNWELRPNEEPKRDSPTRRGPPTAGRARAPKGTSPWRST